MLSHKMIFILDEKKKQKVSKKTGARKYKK